MAELPDEIGNLPLVLGPAGLLPQSPAALLQQLLTLVAKTNPGYTANLPGSLIEDISSTDVAALVLIDQMRVEMLNSLTPRGANAFVLNQLGQIYGVQPGGSSNTSIYVTFTGLPGFVVGKGFTVTDGNYQYALADGGVIGAGGQSQPLYAVATQPGIWAVPAGTVTGIVTSVPAGFSLSVVNQEPGVPGTDAETITSYRSRVLMAGLAASQGMARYLRTILSNVPGVQPRLIGIYQQDDCEWMIIVGGGDPYEVAYAIYTALFNVNCLIGSEMTVVTISKASPGEVTTDLNHGYEPGFPIHIADSDPTNYNGDYAVLASTGNKKFTLGKKYAANAISTATWAAIAAPTNGALTAVAGGTLPAATYFVRSTWVNANGETLAATETSLAVAINNLLRVAAPASAPSSATGWNVYVSTATGTETRQNGAIPIALGTAWTEPVSGLIVGAALPSSSTAGGEGTVNTLVNHNVTVGSTFALSNSIPEGWNGTFVAVAGTVGTILKFALLANPGAITSKGQLVAGVAIFSTVGFPDYVSGAVITPNQRTRVVTLTDYPDTYLIPFVVPPQQSLAITVTWDTTSPNFVSPAAVAQMAVPKLVEYINQVPVGQPLNVYQMEEVFSDAIETILPSPLLSFIGFQVSIDGVGTLPSPGTGLIKGDPQSYFFATEGDIHVVQQGP